MLRSFCFIFILTVCVCATTHAADTPLCILKATDGEVRVRIASGDLRIAELGPLYEGQVLLLSDRAQATIVAGKASVDLGGPLELPITAQVILGSSDKDQSTLIERLAILLPSLRSTADYEGGSVKAPDGTALALIGPRGKVLGSQWRFIPIGANTDYRLELTSLDRPTSANFWLDASGPVTLSGIPGSNFEYIYYSVAASDADWSLAISFDRVSEKDATEVLGRLARECATQLDRVLWLASAGFTYDAWQEALRPTSNISAGEAGLLQSLADRLAATLFSAAP